MGVTAESAVTPTVIVALSAHHALSPAVIDSDSKHLFRRKKKGHERPKLKIISASKAEIKKKMAQICCLQRFQWVERVTVWYLVVRRLQRFLNEAQDETWAAITQQAVRKKEAYTYVLKIMCRQIFKPSINFLKYNLRLVAIKKFYSNFLDFLYLVWLSRYKSIVESNFSNQWRKTSGCRERDAHVWWPESDFPWWQNDRQTEWQPKCLVLAHA